MRRASGAAGTVAPFDLVFADPPYGQGLGEPALASALAGGWLQPGALAVLEERGDVVVAPIAGVHGAGAARHGGFAGGDAAGSNPIRGLRSQPGARRDAFRRPRIFAAVRTRYVRHAASFPSGVVLATAVAFWL